MPKSVAFGKAQEELKRLQKLKQEILGKMPKESNFLTKQLIKLLEKQLEKLEEKIKEVEQTLEEAVTASDMVDPDILGKTKDIFEGVAEGKTDEVVDVFKDIAKDKAQEIIDKEIKDKDLAKTVKDAIDRASEGDMDGVLDVVKDGAKEKAGEVIDKHIGDEEIAAKLKEVLDGVADGDWDGVLDTIKDGVIDIAEGKLEEFIEKLIEQFEAEIKIKIELDMKEEAKALIPKALQETKQKTGPHWSVKLAKNLTKRLFKESVIIIKDEIERLTSEDGLKILIQIAKDAAFETLKSGLLGRKIKDILKELVAQVANHPEFKKIIKDFKRKMLIMFIRVAEEEVEKTVGPVFDAFLRVHTPWVGTLLSTGKQTAKIGPLWGCVSLALSVQADFSAKLTGKRKGLGAIAKGGLSGKAYAGVGIHIGFDIPVVGDVAIEGGVEGGPEINALASIELSSKNAVIQGTVVPITVDIDMSARLYLETPIPNHILKYVPAYLASTSVVQQTIYYPLGRINLLTATTPGYSLTFDLVKKEYAYIGTTGGKYDISVNPKVKAYIKETKEAIEQAAQSVVDAVNPTNWDLNPFDEEGWIGSLF
ncbi:hypothetical protein [Aureispira anguillae]|uniref:Uncharacterized protein n=1 Tax=Aureispira anguillae TaxID=2864201 RepID=A0A916DWQ9_9BACT|nr:hypothetical protein [Aureispira anguillae]BDS15087.1 hypothetical protein AsAng_0058710 [Aureispira anguillae]